MAWNGSQEDWSKGCDKLINFLSKEFDKAKIKNEESKQKKLKTFREKREIFKTEDDVQLAYGYGDITEKERLSLLKELEIGESDILALNDSDAYISLIGHLLSDLRQERECFIG